MIYLLLWIIIGQAWAIKCLRDGEEWWRIVVATAAWPYSMLCKYVPKSWF